MSDSLGPAAALAEKLGRAMEDVLPEQGPVIDCDEIPADRMELRQVAGISAGGCMELRPGSYDFGPVQQGPGRLGDGDPDSVGFTLSLNGNLTAIIGPGETPVSVDSQPVVEPTTLGGRIINAGSARFVVARPRPPQRREGPVREIRLDAVDPWVWQTIPDPSGLGTESYPLIHQRRRFHYGPDEIRHRIEGGRHLLWDRDGSHPLFGTAVVAMADIPLRGVGVEISAPIPISVDLLGSTTMLVGRRELQLAVARHMLMSLATASHPDDLQLALLSDRPELEFVTDLPHASGTASEQDHGRRLFIIDRAEGLEKWPLNGFADERSSVLALTAEDDSLTPSANILTIMNESTISVLGSDAGATIDTATPVGFAAPMVEELVAKLSETHRATRASI